jgi:hypothetical protein
MQTYLQLLQGYYKFLSLGKFFEAEAQTALFTFPAQLHFSTGEHTKFSINADLVSSLLAEIHKHPHQKNVFGYLTEISAFRGIFSVMREMIENVPSFRASLQVIFGEEYFPFEQVIRFLRNVLSHSSTPSLIIQQEDFEKQKIFLAAKKDPKGREKKSLSKVSLHFVYKQYLPEREGSADYACDVAIDFSTLKTGTSLWKVVSLHQMYVLSELCYNISKVISARSNAKKEKTFIQKSPVQQPIKTLHKRLREKKPLL